MPEASDLIDDLAVDVPQPDVPLREGEERFAAGLNLEHNRRRDQEIGELRAALKRLEGTSVHEISMKYASSPSARRRQISARKKIDELRKLTFKRGERWEGPCAPATVINLNPVPLTLQGELQRWTVSPAGSGNTVNLRFRGRQFKGSYMTITTPHLYPAHTGTQSDKQSGVDMPSVEYNYVPPWGLAHQFFDHFVTGAADAQGMGGVLIFEGDIHTLDPKRLERNGGEIWVPKKEITLEGFGDVVYVVEAASFADAVEAAVLMQRNYTDGQVNEGHSYATAQSDIIRNQLSNYHRIWHNFALEMGYLETALPWAVERLGGDKPNMQAVYCPDCHEKQTHPEQWFCSNCNSPFDALKAFLSGKQVSPDRLATYEGEEWDAIVTEQHRREAKIAMLKLPSDEKPKPTRGRQAAATKEKEE